MTWSDLSDSNRDLTVWKTDVLPLNTKAALWGMILLFSGCASTQTAVPVNIQVPVPCLTADQLPAKPAISADADLLKMTDGDFVLSIASDRIALRSYAGELDATIQACIKTAPQ